ncbi:MAG: HNH endonuclease signature motif containing protein [Spirochaetaceae bacterium]|nr:HNH endonuclease signature motif containing protein [Spirochaetaceae bacterium]
MGVGVGGVHRTTCAAGPQFETDRRNAAWAPVLGNRGFPTSAAKRLAYAAGNGAAGPVERSAALERHLAALSCFGALPGSGSRYIPAAVRREVWRRDQGCCSYVDRQSGRRCGSRYRLEIDHIVPVALGGGAEPANLRVRCRAHHRLRHAPRPAHAESVPNEARRAPLFAVDRNDYGRTVRSHAAI